MKKSSTSRKPYPAASRRRVREAEPFIRRKVDVRKFKPDLSAAELQALVIPAGSVSTTFPFFMPIDTLSVTKTVGRGRTNLTFIRPTIVQADATTPRATFDLRETPTRNPIIQMHFEPSGYGISSVATYIMEFNVEVDGQSTFNLTGFAGSGTIANGGTKRLTGRTKVSLILRNVPPNQQTFGFLEQTSGGRWNWFSTEVRFPPLVITTSR